MKNLIKKILKEYAEEQEKILVVPSFKYFNNNWGELQSYLKSQGNPKWKIMDDLDLNGKPIESLENLEYVDGHLDLSKTQIKSLENLEYVGDGLFLYDTPIESLGDLTTVNGYMTLMGTDIKSLGNLTTVKGNLNLFDSKIESLGNLEYVVGDLTLKRTPISIEMTEEEIRKKVYVKGTIYI